MMKVFGIITKGSNPTNYNNDIFAKTDANGKLSPIHRFIWNRTYGNPTITPGIIGWAFHGLSVYGPYGYTSYTSGGAILDGSITNIKSCFELRSGTRSSGPWWRIYWRFCRRLSCRW